MKRSEERLVSRGLDRELDADERKRLDALMTADAEARSSARSWERMGDALRSVTQDVDSPDPTLAWQDIRRSIRQLEPGSGDEAFAPARSGRPGWAVALAAVAVIGLLGWSAWRLVIDKSGAEPAVAAAPESRVEWVVAEVPGATTMIYTDEETELTVIWMDIAQNDEPRDT